VGGNEHLFLTAESIPALYHDLPQISALLDFSGPEFTVQNKRNIDLAPTDSGALSRHAFDFLVLIIRPQAILHLQMSNPRVSMYLILGKLSYRQYFILMHAHVETHQM